LSSPIPEEISDEILKQIIPGVTGGGTLAMPGEPITVAELRELLKPLGLDITTAEAVDWGLNHPVQARNVTQICKLEQQIADVQHALPVEKKEAAE
jgi:hypothetical protein